MKNKILAFAVAMTMAGSLVACASGSSTGANSAAQNAETEAAESEAAETEAAEGEATETEADTAQGGFSIVTTIFPEYDWVQSILGENPAGAEVTMLLDDGVDLHSFQPTTEDILKVSTCDMFIYVGGESDDWVESALAEAENEDMIVIDLLDVLGDSVKEEEIVEGMEHDHDHEHEEGEEDHDHEAEEAEHEEEHDHEQEEAEYDEHVWLSLKSTIVLCQNIAQALETMDPANAAVYEANASAYSEKLNALDAGYEAAVSEAKVKTLLFGDRFPFLYMTDDYGLEYFAAFAGCSAESEASFETIAFLAQKVDELGLRSVMTIEGTDHRIAETIVKSTKTQDQKILTMDSMQSTTAEDVAGGATYLSIMESNLEVLKEALQNDQ